MNNRLVRLALAVAILCLSSSSLAHADTLTGKVVAVADGDTITVLPADKKQERIRFQGIDAPEKAQAFGNVSKEHVASLVFGKTVTVEYAKRDKYGRIVGKVLLDGKDINLEQLRAGLAWFYKQYENELSEADRKSYVSAETEAKAAKRGLWKDANPTAPWEFRHPGKPTSDAPAATSSSQSAGQIIGNKRSMIYHLPNCPDYSKISEKNRQYFKTKEEAEKAGYRMARNCP
jgi:endonuclease YncB( thermonuclease family)